MSDRKMIDGLSHKRSFCTDDSLFFAAIDAAGGWPVGYQFVGFEHTDERAAGFTNIQRNTGWWTVVASADDYYLWKLSPAAIQRVIDAALNAARITRPDASQLWIKNSSGSRAAIAKATGEQQ